METNILILIDKLLRGEITPSEMARLYDCYDRKMISEDIFSDFYDRKWSEAGESIYKNDLEKEVIWKKVQQQLWRYSIRTVGMKMIRNWQQMAALVVVALLFTGLGIYLGSASPHSMEELSVAVENGQKAKVNLPDGSHVWLNSASELSYSPDFGTKERKVMLRGEAYFEVESDSKHPFIVETGEHLQITATGTKFNVKSYPGESIATATLLEGKILARQEAVSYILVPYDKISFNKLNKKFSVSRIRRKDEVLCWMTDRFVFNNETLEEITKTLERMYNVDFLFRSESLKKITYSGTVKNNSLENVLMLISTAAPVSYQLRDSVIYLDEK